MARLEGEAARPIGLLCCIQQLYAGFVAVVVAVGIGVGTKVVVGL